MADEPDQERDEQLADKPAEKAEEPTLLVKRGVEKPRRFSRPALVGGGAALALVAVVGGLAVFSQLREGDVADAAGAERNGIEDDPIGEIGERIDGAMRELTSVRVVLQPTDAQLPPFDLRLDVDGDCSGSVGADGAFGEVLAVDDQFFFRPGPEYWAAYAGTPSEGEGEGEGGDQAAQIAALQEVVGDRWIDGTESADATSLGILCQQGLEALLGDTYDADAFEEDGWLVSDEVEVDGDPAVTLTNGAGSATLRVATTGEPFILEAEVAQGASGATYTFSEQNEPLDLSVPPADEIATNEELQAAVGG
ncbi:hypothetical protein QE364_003257 [Nocardioides zeae]|uniref:Uncharacterized protein n=1 Tax=Nocardioides zeae TaxID=1457234 RepID=A0ACC6ILH0_9ACTN|nr:hypothetical protein [Nocardioides zeae]MDR6173911.1 hypothetical protein [Nocardioides zeae]MDR6211533.1 hypothetical protein [Nocardioides zeae]